MRLHLASQLAAECTPPAGQVLLTVLELIAGDRAWIVATDRDTKNGLETAQRSPITRSPTAFEAATRMGWLGRALDLQTTSMQDRRLPLSSRPTPGTHSSRNSLLTAAVAAALAAQAPAQLQFTTLPRTTLPSVPNSTSAIALGDVDGDGDLDLFRADGAWFSWQLALLLNDGSGRFTDVSATQLPAATTPIKALAVGDVDGDGDFDLVCGTGATLFNQNAPQTRLLYLNDGSGTYTDASANINGANFTNTIALADIDQDGDLDLLDGGGLLWNNGYQAASGNYVFTNDGSGSFAFSSRLSPDGLCNDLAVGDVDGDSDLDLVLGNYWVYTYYNNANQDQLFLNDGAGAFTAGSASWLSPPILSNAVALGDVDGDGDLDLAIGHPSTGCHLYLNDGAGVFTDHTASHLPANSGAIADVAFGDLDGDGDQDLVVLGGQVRFYRNDGAGSFDDVTSVRMPGSAVNARRLAVGDVDGDRDLDLALGLARTGPGPDLLYSNVQRQLDAPSPLLVGQTYTLDAYLRYVQPSPGGFAVPAVSFWPAPAPFPTPFGKLGLDPNQILVLPLISVAQPTGMGSLNLAIPNAPGVVGATLYSQALLVPTSAPLQSRLSNVAKDVLQ